MKIQFILLSLVLLCSCNKLKGDYDFLLGEWEEVNSEQPASILFSKNKVSFKNIHNRITSKKIKSIESDLFQLYGANQYAYILKYENNETKSFFSNLNKDTLFFKLSLTGQSNENLFIQRMFIKKSGL